jgi:hypothetical protein
MVKFSELQPSDTLGVPRLFRFDFAFDTPNLNTGVEVYTPTVGDILLDVGFVITEAFDGTTPMADVTNAAAGFPDGIFYEWYGSIELDAGSSGWSYQSGSEGIQYNAAPNPGPLGGSVVVRRRAEVRRGVGPAEQQLSDVSAVP